MEERQRARRSPRWSRRLEVLLSGTVGLLALFVSAYTVYIQRQQLKIQAWPRLTIVGESTPGPGPNDFTLTLSLKNRGVAPAEVRSMRVTVADEPVTDWVDWLNRSARKQGAGDHFPKFGMWEAPVSSVISVGGESPLFTTTSPDIISVLVGDRATAMSVCYCSVLDDCWMYESSLSGSADMTLPVARCPKETVRFTGKPSGADKEWVRGLREAAVDARANRDAGSVAK
jgi:hypothetical protein